MKGSAFVERHQAHLQAAESITDGNPDTADNDFAAS